MTEAEALVGPPSVAPTDKEGGRLLVHRLRLLAALGVSCAIFWYVGPWVVHPIDPQGPVTLIVVPQGIIAMAELLGLAVVASGLAVAMCGAQSAHRGPLAVAVGLATLSLRGSQLEALVLARANTLDPGFRPTDAFPTAALVAETWLWLALVAVGIVVGRWVGDWFEPAPVSIARGQRLGGRTGDLRLGLGTTAVTALVAWCVVTYSGGDEVSPNQKGQIFFAAGLSFLVGSLVSYWFFLETPRVWLLLAVALVASGAYCSHAPGAAELEAAHRAGTHVGLRPIVRPLPIEYASMGAVGALLQEDAAAFLRALLGLRPSERSGAV